VRTYIMYMHTDVRPLARTADAASPLPDALLADVDGDARYCAECPIVRALNYRPRTRRVTVCMGDANITAHWETYFLNAPLLSI